MTLVLFFAGLAFTAYVAGRFQSRGEARTRLLWISTNLAMLAMGIGIGTCLMP